jgi:hypothetical protein
MSTVTTLPRPIRSHIEAMNSALPPAAVPRLQELEQHLLVDPQIQRALLYGHASQVVSVHTAESY